MKTRFRSNPMTKMYIEDEARSFSKIITSDESDYGITGFSLSIKEEDLENEYENDNVFHIISLFPFFVEIKRDGRSISFNNLYNVDLFMRMTGERPVPWCEPCERFIKQLLNKEKYKILPMLHCEDESVFFTRRKALLNPLEKNGFECYLTTVGHEDIRCGLYVPREDGWDWYSLEISNEIPLNVLLEIKDIKENYKKTQSEFSYLNKISEYPQDFV